MPDVVLLTQLRMYFQKTLHVFGLITEDRLNYPLIDRSFRMEASLNDLKLL